MVTCVKVNSFAGTNMANGMTETAQDLVQCPVCLKDFTPDTINGHLDVCLLNTDSSPSTAEESEPPVKKPRVSLAAAPSSSAVNKSVVSSSSSSAMFSVFQTNKSKVSGQSERNGLFPIKQSPTSSAVNKGVKRVLSNEADSGSSGVENSNSQTSSPQGPTVKGSNDLKLRTLLTTNKPLAEILRPDTLDEYFGQNKIVGHQTLLRTLLDSQEIPSLILWGPPGCGKVGLEQWCNSYYHAESLQQQHFIHSYHGFICSAWLQQ